MADPGARSALPRQKIKIGRHRADLARKPVEALSTLGGADGERGCVLRRGSFGTLRTLAQDEVTSLRHKDVVAELGRFEGARNQAHHPARLLRRSAGRRVGPGRAAVPRDRKRPRTRQEWMPKRESRGRHGSRRRDGSSGHRCQRGSQAHGGAAPTAIRPVWAARGSSRCSQDPTLTSPPVATPRKCHVPAARKLPAVPKVSSRN